MLATRNFASAPNRIAKLRDASFLTIVDATKATTTAYGDGEVTTATTRRSVPLDRGITVWRAVIKFVEDVLLDTPCHLDVEAPWQ